VAIAPSNPNRVYALIETGDGVPWHGKETDRGQVWRSDDGGETWRVVSYDQNAMGRAPYYSHIFVAPDNENETYYLTAIYSVSLDGGLTLVEQQRNQTAPGGDHHDTWIDPTNPNRIRTLTGPKAPGLNRLYWDLRYEPSKEVRLRTSPLYAPEVQVGPEGWRPARISFGRLAILAPPGTYTVQLSIGGKQLTQKLEVKKDPHSAGTEADIQQQVKVLFELRRDMD
jgi:hypothetical protein